MSNKAITMSKIRQLLRLYQQEESKMKISALTGISRNTVKKYIKCYHRLNVTFEELESYSDNRLEEIFGIGILPDPADRKADLLGLFPEIEKKLKKRGYTGKLAWMDYRERYPEGYSYSHFKDIYSHWKKSSKISMHIDHKAGDKMFIDFAGDKLHLVDPLTGEIIPVEVFVAILGASQLTYVQAVESQRIEDLIHCCINALNFYQGVPKAIVPDNMKSAVTKSDRYEPTVNEAFENFALHYSTAILPTRAYKPKDKALVEGAVKISYQRIYAHLHGQTFFSLEDLNAAILKALEVHNTTRMSSRPYSRRQLFEEVEKQELSPLPEKPYEFKKQQIATVASTCHICLSEDKHYYSVPYTHIGKKVKVLYGKLQVDVFYKYQCIASHPRVRAPFKYTTVKEHMASTHQFISEWHPERYMNWASKIDESVRDYIEHLLASKVHPEQAYKACQGVLNYERKVGRDRLINACKRASEYGNYGYQIIKNILENRLDKLHEAEPAIESAMPEHENIRGEEYYQ